MGTGAGSMVSNHNLDITLSKNLGGYILIELLLVIAIVALIATQPYRHGQNGSTPLG